MRVAVPTFGSRVAPSFLHCESMLLARLVGESVVSTETLLIRDLTEDGRIKVLEDQNISVLVCGGIDCGLTAELKSLGIEVINNVAGESDAVLAHLARGNLRQGFGITYLPGGNAPAGRIGVRGPEQDQSPPPAPPPTSPQPDAPPPDEGSPQVNCVDCADRTCLQGGECSQGSGPSSPEAPDVRLRLTMDVTEDIAAEPERIQCRISELVYFCLGMKYDRLGLAFCTELFTEAETVARVLSRFIPVTPVCCRVGGAPAAAEDSPGGLSGPSCNPYAMARVLNEAQTDLNVILGLCMGSDVIFTELSDAPVTTLFVKDRLLANNPIGAVHSRYALKDLISTP